MNSYLNLKFSIQLYRGLLQIYALFSHERGIVPNYKLFKVESSSVFITISPFIANFKLFKESLIVVIKILYLFKINNYLSIS